MQTLNILDVPKVIQMLLSEPPGGAISKWSKRVLLIKRNRKKESGLAAFVDFVNDEKLIVKDSIKIKIY